MNKSNRGLVVVVSLLGGLAVGRWMPDGVASQLVKFTGRPDLVAAAASDDSPLQAKSVKPSGNGAVAEKVDKAQSTNKALANEAEALSLWLELKNAAKDDLMAEKNVLSALKRWLDKDPQAAIEFVFGLKGPRAEKLLAGFLREIKPEQMKLALDVFLKHPEMWQTLGLANTILEGYAKVDPESAWREATLEGRSFPHVVGAIARSWAAAHPQDALAFSSSIQDRTRRSEFTREALTTWGRTDANAFLAWIAAQPDRDSWVEQVQWVAIDLASEEQFLAMVKLVPPQLLERERGPFSYYTPNDWVSRADWIEKLPEGETRTVLLNHAAKQLSRSDPEKALLLLDQLPPGSARNNTAAIVAAYRAAASPQDGLAFAEGLANEKARALARLSAVQTWALSDPAGAAAWFVANGKPGERSAIYFVARNWAEDEPEKAVAFALGNEAADGRMPQRYGSIIGAAMEQWVRQDAYGASHWVSQIENGPQRDRAISALAQSAVDAEPDGALAWASGIGNAGLRQSTIESCVEQWSRRNQAAATAWVNGSGLDASAKSKLLDRISSNSSAVSTGSSWRVGMTVLY